MNQNTSNTLNILSRLINLDKFKLMGRHIRGPCPIHHGSNFSSFSIDPERGIWHCFSCGEGGSLKKLVNLLDPTGKMLKKLLIRAPPCFKANKPKHNKPLQFSLTLDNTHPYLQNRNILPETTKTFSIGHCNHGIMKNRIAIPIHDEKGNLVAYAGRRINDNYHQSENPENFPKYRFPKGFIKQNLIYNYHRILKSNKDKVILVEGFFDIFRMYQYGFSAVSVMGTLISSRQLDLIKQLNKHIIIFFDGDRAGIKGTGKAIQLFTKHKLKYSIINIFGKDPDNTSAQTLKLYQQLLS